MHRHRDTCGRLGGDGFRDTTRRDRRTSRLSGQNNRHTAASAEYSGCGALSGKIQQLRECQLHDLVTRETHREDRSTGSGDADMGTSQPKLQIAAFGMEKIVPDRESLGVFTRLLARSATGQPITTYTSHYRKPQSVI